MHDEASALIDSMRPPHFIPIRVIPLISPDGKDPPGERSILT